MLNLTFTKSFEMSIKRKELFNKAGIVALVVRENCKLDSTKSQYVMGWQIFGEMASRHSKLKTEEKSLTVWQNFTYWSPSSGSCYGAIVHYKLKTVFCLLFVKIHFLVSLLG